MYLRAERISLYFPVPGGRHSERQLPSTARLGGSAVMRHGKPCIRALHDVSLALQGGDRLGVIGHNGSGKSTLLRTLAGLYSPHEGRVEASAPVSGIFNLSVGFRQEATGVRNILLKGLMAGKSRREIEAAIPDIAAFTELGPFLDMPLNTYSQGMALRLAFAITTTFAHDILVMDEWIGAGDAQFQERVVARMNSVLENAHICVLASHNRSLLQRLTDRCLWMEDGRVKMEGPTPEVTEVYEEEVRRLQREAEAANAVPRLPIPAGHRVIEVLPPALPDSSAVELRWDLERFNVARVKLTVHDPVRDRRQLVCTAPAASSRRTGDWVRPGIEFELHDDRDGALLGAVTIEPRHLVAPGRAALPG
ncbi:MAG TPA: ABC transporter ATP-binding protein [Xanthomonadaceae bacterium]|nr:ABC transporter ATP-binding protein [Xanthomonadaceae bacterium]